VALFRVHGSRVSRCALARDDEIGLIGGWKLNMSEEETTSNDPPTAAPALRRISTGSPMEQTQGYSRAVVDADYVHVSGTTGYDYATMRMSDDPVEQCEQAFRNIEAVLASARCRMADIVRVVYYVPVREDFRAMADTCRRWLGPNPPAATMLVCGLYDEKMKIEIEVTARRPAGSTAGS
jgi:enamine deaminase RidA (YjgF/YER057c/UK114 family)